MTRLLALLRWETMIQFRLGIFYAAAFIAAVWILMLYWIPDAGIEPVLVSVLFIDLGVFGFFFMPGLYYLEKGERVLEGLVVTPLRSWEYLSVKIVVLSDRRLRSRRGRYAVRLRHCAQLAVVRDRNAGDVISLVSARLCHRRPLQRHQRIPVARRIFPRRDADPAAHLLRHRPGTASLPSAQRAGHDFSHRRVCQHSSLATHIRAALRRRSMRRRHTLDTAYIAQCRCSTGWWVSLAVGDQLPAIARTKSGGMDGGPVHTGTQ